VEIDRKSCCRSKVIKHLLEARRSFLSGLTEDKGVVRILEDGAGGTRGEGVKEGVTRRSVCDKALEHIRHDNEKVWGEGVALPKAVATADPGARNPIKEDRGMPSVQDALHPETPTIVETTSFEDG
jgi:hypothetical protein